MIKCSIDVTKIEKARLYKGKKGTYLDVILIDNRDGEDQYGNSGMVIQEVSKEEREAGQRGPIIGNFKIIGKKEKPATRLASRPAAKPAPDPDLDGGEEDCPF